MGSGDIQSSPGWWLDRHLHRVRQVRTSITGMHTPRVIPGESQEAKERFTPASVDLHQIIEAGVIQGLMQLRGARVPSSRCDVSHGQGNVDY